VPTVLGNLGDPLHSNAFDVVTAVGPYVFCLPTCNVTSHGSHSTAAKTG
jgi:hypothetical protein